MTDSVDHDYDLPKEELTSSAVYPPMLSLKLESRQGYPQVINIEASGDSRDAGVTVQDVLRTIHEDLRMPFSRHELSKLGAEERTGLTLRLKRDARVKRSSAKARIGLTAWAVGTGSRFYRNFRPTAYTTSYVHTFSYTPRNLCELTDFL